MATQCRTLAGVAVCSQCGSHLEQASPYNAQIRAGTLAVGKGILAISFFWRCCVDAVEQPWRLSLAGSPVLQLYMHWPPRCQSRRTNPCPAADF